MQGQKVEILNPGGSGLEVYNRIYQKHQRLEIAFISRPAVSVLNMKPVLKVA